MMVDLCQCGETATRHTTRLHFCERHWPEYLKTRCQERVYDGRGDHPCTLTSRWLVAGVRYCSKHVKRAGHFMGQAPIEIKEARQ